MPRLGHTHALVASSHSPDSPSCTLSRRRTGTGVGGGGETPTEDGKAANERESTDIDRLGTRGRSDGSQQGWADWWGRPESTRENEDRVWHLGEINAPKREALRQGKGWKTKLGARMSAGADARGIDGGSGRRQGWPTVAVAVDGGGSFRDGGHLGGLGGCRRLRP